LVTSSSPWGGLGIFPQYPSVVRREHSYHPRVGRWSACEANRVFRPIQPMPCPPRYYYSGACSHAPCMIINHAEDETRTALSTTISRIGCSAHLPCSRAVRRHPLIPKADLHSFPHALVAKQKVRTATLLLVQSPADASPRSQTSRVWAANFSPVTGYQRI